MAAVLVIHTALEVHLLCVRTCTGPRAPATLLRMPLMLAAATAAATAAADRALATFK